MDYLALFGAFFIFLLFALFFYPFVGGCLIMFFVLAICATTILFFSFNLIWFVIFGGILYIIGFGYKYYKWYKLPDYNNYIKKYPHAHSPSGITCYTCNSEKLVNQGLFVNKSKLRFYFCGTCGTVLFRFKVL